MTPYGRQGTNGHSPEIGIDGFTTVLLNTVSGGGAEMAIRLNGVLTLMENDIVL